MSRPCHPASGQRGVALVVAILVLVALAAIALTMMSTIVADRRLTGYDLMASKALNNAEAGIAEAMERIRNRDVPDTEDPKMVAQIFLASMGDIPVTGADTTALATGQPAGARMAYSTEDKGPDVLTIRYKTTSDGTKIYRFDALSNPAVNTTKGSPIYVISAVGRDGTARRKVETEVANPLLAPNLKAAVTTTWENNELKEDTWAIGYDYRLDTPTGTSSNGARDGSWETVDPPLPGALAKKDVKLDGGALAYGSPATLSKQPVPYNGPWEVLNMTQSHFYNWLGPANWDKKQGVPRGLTHLDKPGGKLQEHNDKFSIKGGFNGDGLLYVNGNLEVSGDFTFRGLIYCEGEFKVHGSAWILGAVVARKTHIHAKSGGPITILRSRESVAHNISKYGSGFTTLAWREVSPN